MKNSEAKNKQKIQESQDYFIHLVFQVQEITIWNIKKTQSQTMRTQRNATMGS